MGDYLIRQATPSDQDAVEAINRQSWSGRITTHQLLENRHGRLNDRDWTERIVQAVSEHLSQPEVITFVAEQQGKVIGYAAAQISLQPWADVGAVSYNAVLPEHRGCGVGSALIEHVMHYLKAKGARVLTVVTLDSDDPAKHIYERLGFEPLAVLIYYSQKC